MRSVPEWIAKSDDAAIPPRVRLRIFEAHGGRCHISGRLIRAGEPWDCDHIVALVNGGQHRESNLAPALRDKHREKTADDVREKSIVRRKAMKSLGIAPKKGRPMPGSKASGFKKCMNGNVERRERFT